MIRPLVMLKTRSWVIRSHKNYPHPSLRLSGGGQGEVDDLRGAPCQAGHCKVQPVSFSGGEVLSPGTMESTWNKSSGSPAGLVSAWPTKAEVISWWSPLR